MSTLFKKKFEGGSFSFRKPSYLEAMRIRGQVIRNCRKYMGNYTEEDEIETEEWMAEFIACAEPLFLEFEGVDSYLQLFENENAVEIAMEAVNFLIDFMYMDSKKKASSVISQQDAQVEAQ